MTTIALFLMTFAMGYSDPAAEVAGPASAAATNGPNYRLEFRFDPPLRTDAPMIVFGADGEYAAARTVGGSDWSQAVEITGAFRSVDARRLRVNYQLKFTEEDQEADLRSTESISGSVTVAMKRSAVVGFVGRRQLSVTASIEESEQPALLPVQSVSPAKRKPDGLSNADADRPSESSSLILREIGCSNIVIFSINSQMTIGGKLEPEKSQDPSPSGERGSRPSR